MLSSPLSGNDWPEPTAEALLTRVPLPENCPPRLELSPSEEGAVMPVGLNGLPLHGQQAVFSATQRESCGVLNHLIGKDKRKIYM